MVAKTSSIFSRLIGKEQYNLNYPYSLLFFLIKETVFIRPFVNWKIVFFKKNEFQKNELLSDVW